jgi:hypothetical protein
MPGGSNRRLYSKSLGNSSLLLLLRLKCIIHLRESKLNRGDGMLGRTEMIAPFVHGVRSAIQHTGRRVYDDSAMTKLETIDESRKGK